MVQINTQSHKKAMIIATVFAVIYASISWINHYLFRTYAFDLGLYNHTIYDYLHGRFNDSLLIEPIHRQRNQLGDHFDLMLMLISPLQLVFGTYTLLVVQWAMIISGGIGVYLFFDYQKSKLAPLAMMHFYSIWGILSALGFDYHSNVVAAMCVPWLFYFFIRQDKTSVIITCILIMICKENMALWLAFILLGISLLKDFSSLKNFARILSVLAIIYFLVVVKIIMPSMVSPELKYIHLTYSQLGNGISDIIQNVFTQPFKIFKLLFISPYDEMPESYGIKLQLHVFVMFSGGLLLFLRPQFWVMLIPIFAQKLFHDDIIKWGICLQYSIEFVPIIAIGAMYVIHQYDWGNRIKKYVAYCIISSSLFLSYYSINHRLPGWFHTAPLNFLSTEHYKQTFDVHEVHRVLSLIPEELAVGASPNLTPHLAFRKVIYSFPKWENVDIVVLLKKQESYFPFSQEVYEAEIERLRKDTQSYHLKYESDALILFAKKHVNFEVVR